MSFCRFQRFCAYLCIKCVDRCFLFLSHFLQRARFICGQFPQIQLVRFSLEPMNFPDDAMVFAKPSIFDLRSPPTLRSSDQNEMLSMKRPNTKFQPVASTFTEERRVHKDAINESRTDSEIDIQKENRVSCLFFS